MHVSMWGKMSKNGLSESELLEFGQEFDTLSEETQSLNRVHVGNFHPPAGLDLYILRAQLGLVIWSRFSPNMPLTFDEICTIAQVPPEHQRTLRRHLPQFASEADIVQPAKAPGRLPLGEPAGKAGRPPKGYELGFDSLLKEKPEYLQKLLLYSVSSGHIMKLIQSFILMAGKVARSNEETSSFTDSLAWIMGELKEVTKRTTSLALMRQGLDKTRAEIRADEIASKTFPNFQDLMPKLGPVLSAMSMIKKDKVRRDARKVTPRLLFDKIKATLDRRRVHLTSQSALSQSNQQEVVPPK
jgi:hypothetical protein